MLNLYNEVSMFDVFSLDIKTRLGRKQAVLKGQKWFALQSFNEVARRTVLVRYVYHVI